MALIIGFLSVALLGLFHHLGLRMLDAVTGTEKAKPNVTIASVFFGLLAIHTVEILLFAVAYYLLLHHSWIGDLTGEFDRSWESLIYFSGINFTTLGLAQVEPNGPIRMVSMMQSLGGFMILTWSATFIYSAWEKAFR